MLASFEEAEDLVQETFLRAWRKRDSFEGGPGFRPGGVQLLPPRQRAVLILRDVLDWSAREAAGVRPPADPLTRPGQGSG